MRQIIIGLLLLMNVISLQAQDENPKNLTGKSKGFSMFYGGVEASTASYIYTKTADSTGTALYLAPYLDYNHSSGFGIRVKTYILPGGSDPGFFLTSLSPYFGWYDGMIYPYISYTRYVDHKNPSIPYSPIQNEVYAHLKFKTRFVDPWIGMDIGFGNNEQNNDDAVSDINAFLAITHLFLKENLGAKKNNALAIQPGLQLNAATDRYFKFMRTGGYISQNTKPSRLGYGRGPGASNGGNGSSSGAESYIISEENDFDLSNLEANVYIMYFLGDFSIEPSGSLYFPFRGADRSPYGYWQINLNYWIK